MSKILLFGGSFNPPHNAHLAIAKLALKQSHAFELWFVPNLDHPFQKKDMVPFEYRALMLDELIKPYKKFRVCRIEAELDSPSYTVDTLRALEDKFPENQFMWLMGSDQLMDFAKWKDAELLKSQYEIYVFRRDIKDIIETPFREIISRQLFSISSTEVRLGQLKFCPKTVIKKFVEYELYLESVLQNLISTKRYNHVISVTKLALSLASAHNIDLHQTLLASLFHDCAKEWPKEKMKKWLAVIDPSYLNQAAYLWHARLGSDWIKRNLHVYDKDILYAIQHHVYGDEEHPLTQVLYIADKCEETRGYDASPLLNIAYRNLKDGYFAVKKSQADYLEKDNE